MRNRVVSTCYILVALWVLLCPVQVLGGACDDFARSDCRIDVELHKSFVKETDETITRASIANPEIADVDVVTPTQALITARDKPGTTSLTLWHGDDLARVYDVRVVVPSSIYEGVQNQIDRLVPEARARVIPAANGVILDGEVESQEMLDRVLCMVKGYINLPPENNLIVIRGSQQVQLEVKIAEVSRSGMKQMGLGFLNNNDWTVGIFSAGTVTGGATTALSQEPTTTITEQAIAGSSSYSYRGTETTGGASKTLDSLMEIASPFSSAFQIALHSVKDDSLAILSLLKGQGLSRILASPTLVTMSGQEADFLVGGEYPYPVQGDLGQITIEYKRFGVMLRFTPMVVGKETITIQVEPEVSSLDFSLSVNTGGVAVPGLRTRRGSTTLQLKDGQTFAMAGLLSEEARTIESKIPFLGDIPILGTLFTSKEFEKNETELVIIVTTRLVRAMNPDEVPLLPGQEDNDNVNDLDFFLLNRTRNPAKTSTENIRPDFNAVQGFVGGAGFAR